MFIFRDILDSPIVVAPSLPQDKESLLRWLEKTNPESLALARDWEDTAEALMKTKAKLEGYVSFQYFLQVSLRLTVAYT